MGEVVIHAKDADTGRARTYTMNCTRPPDSAAVVTELEKTYGPGSLQSLDGAIIVLPLADVTVPWGTYRYVPSVISGE